VISQHDDDANLNDNGRLRSNMLQQPTWHHDKTEVWKSPPLQRFIGTTVAY